MKDIERILALASTVGFQMDVLKRRVQGKPGHQGVTPRELIASARRDLDSIEAELESDNE